MKKLAKTLTTFCLTLFAFIPATAQKYTSELVSDSLSGACGEYHATIKMTVDYPGLHNGNPSLNDSIRTWLFQFIKVSDGSGLPAYTGNIQDGKAVVGHYVNAYVKQFTQQSPDSAYNMSYELTARKVYENRQYVSYRAELYNYEGGAHGMPYTGLAIFRKSDGRILTWSKILKKSGLPILKRQLVHGVMKYLQVKTWAEAKGSLFLEAPYNSMATFPMPASNPGLTAKGLVAVYQSYEIGPYAIGQPEVIIPGALFPQILQPAIVKTLRK